MKISKEFYKDLNKQLLNNPPDEMTKRLISRILVFLMDKKWIVVDIHRTYPTVHAITVDSNLGLQLKHILELFNVNYFPYLVD